jgi:polyhydroxybutyrate depolymerase
MNLLNCATIDSLAGMCLSSTVNGLDKGKKLDFRRLTKIASSLGLLALLLCWPHASAQQGARAGKGWDYGEKIQSRGFARTYTVHVPPSYVSGRPIPVLLVFHGSYMNGLMMLHVTGFNKIADRRYFAVVYPDGVKGHWEDGRVERTADDIGFVSDMLQQLKRRIKIDERRIYAVGLSNGGYFVQKLACDTNDVAAIAVVASALSYEVADNCRSTRKVPVLFMAGTADPLVPSHDPAHNADLGKIGEALGIGSLGSLTPTLASLGGIMTEEQTLAFWCEHNHCSTSPYVKTLPDVDPHDGTRVKCETYGGYGGEVVYYKIEGGGHNWPGSFYFAPKDILGTISHDIDASEIIVDFLLRHSY